MARNTIPKELLAQSAYWCFTLNNYTAEDEEIIQAFGADESKCKYLVYGREVGLEGTPHLQGYLELKARMRGHILKAKISCDNIYLQARKGKGYQAADYCKKDGDLYEVGTAPPVPKKDSTKARWASVLAQCIAGNWKELQENEPYLWLTNEKKLRSHFQCKKMLDHLDNEWIYGPTGTGKSRDARARFPDAYIKDASTHWWDGYNGESVVIIEDLDKYHVKLGYYLKIWGDHYAFPAQIKGGQMMARPDKIIVTSNYSPSEIWQDTSTTGPITRRFKLIHKEQVPHRGLHVVQPELPDLVDLLPAVEDWNAADPELFLTPALDPGLNRASRIFFGLSQE